MTEKRNIQTIAPLLADDFVDLEASIFDTDGYSLFLNNNEKRLGAYKKYLICKLHDSCVIDTEQDNDNFKIILNDFSTYVFANTLIEKFNLPIDSDHISFPLTLEFQGILKVEFIEVENKGNLIQIDPIKIHEYLYEQITHLDQEKIEIVFHFWKSNIKDNKPGERIIVIVSAKDLTITENQDQAWREVFGDKYNSLYKYFKEQFDSDRYVSNHNECEKLIDEFEQNRMTN
jgi:hypothetical protein